MKMREAFQIVLLACVMAILAFRSGYLSGKRAGIAETKALWRTEVFRAPEAALWDKATYDKAVAEEVERQKEVKR